MKIAFALVALGAAAVSAKQEWPTLPTRWVATTNEPEVGVGVEAYRFVAEPTEENPSALWSNYTGCQRLIMYERGSKEAFAKSGRYMLGCDSVDCCIEEQQENQVEFQIPNEKGKKPKYAGKEKLVTKFGKEIEADVWAWSDLFVEDFKAYTTPCANCANNVTLWRWHVSFPLFKDQSFDVDFENFHGILPHEEEKFDAQFNIPEICSPSQGARKCDDLREQGILKTKFESPAEKMMRAIKALAPQIPSSPSA